MADENSSTGQRRFELPTWVRRVGVFSWLFIGFVLAVGAFALLFAVFSPITIPVVLAACLAVVFAPVVTWLADHGLSRSLAAIAVLLGLVGIVVVVVWVTSAALVDQSEELSENLGKAVDDIKGWLADSPISEQLADQASETTTDSGPALASGLAGGAVSVINSITGIITGTVLALIVLYYMLKDDPTSGGKRSESPTDKQALLHRISDDAVQDLRG